MVILVQWPGHTSERGPCKLQFFLNILSKSERKSLIKDVFGASILSICGFSTSFRGDFGWSTWISIYGKIKKKHKKKPTKTLLETSVQSDKSIGELHHFDYYWG